MKLTCAIDEIKTLTPEKTNDILNKDKKGDYLLLDVREPAEYAIVHIPGAVLIPLNELESRQKELDHNKKIITYCRSGHRSMAAAIMLCGQGFRSIHHMGGGMLNWHFKTITGDIKQKPKLITNTAKSFDILTLSIKLEIGSQQFYILAAERSIALPVKDTFKFLAGVEDKHAHRLYEHTTNLKSGFTLPPLNKIKQDHEILNMEGGIEINPALFKIDDVFGSELEALELSVEKEYMSYDFYKRASLAVNDSNAKALLNELALEERNHASMLLQRLSEKFPRKQD